MLTKLLKYDIKASVNKVILIYGSLALALAGFFRLFDLFDGVMLWETVSKICFGAAISMAVTMLINVVIHTWVNFSSSVYGDRGYLTHTLPITKGTIYRSKLIAAFVALLLGMAVMLVTLFILLFSDAYFEIIKELFSTIGEIYQMDVGVLLTVMVLELLVQTFAMIQSGLIGIILGHRCSNAKTGLSFLFGAIVYMISQTLALILSFAFGLFNRDLLDLIFTTNAPSVDMVKTVLLVALVVYAVVNVIFYFIAIAFFKKGVNLD